MPISRCPGQDQRFWTPDDVFELPCPHCGDAIEFWKDDPRLKCRSCGEVVENPRFDLGCAAWCRYAEACLGVVPKPAEDRTLADALVRRMREVFGSDFRRIRHALEVLRHAERLHETEGGDPLVIRAAAILHDIGIQEAERQHGSAASRYQEIEGPPIARRILESLGVDAERIDHVCRIIGSHHSAGDIDTPEFRILWDADRLANLAEECGNKTRDEARAFVERAYRTDTGRTMGGKAVERFFGE